MAKTTILRDHLLATLAAGHIVYMDVWDDETQDWMRGSMHFHDADDASRIECFTVRDEYTWYDNPDGIMDADVYRNFYIIPEDLGSGVRKFGKLILVMALMFGLTSCYHMTHVVGNGPQGNTVAKAHQAFFLKGIVPGKPVDTKAMANGATDYRIDTRKSFGDWLVGGVTFGIYTPFTVIVTR